MAHNPAVAGLIDDKRDGRLQREFRRGASDAFRGHYRSGFGNLAVGLKNGSSHFLLLKLE